MHQLCWVPPHALRWRRIEITNSKRVASLLKDKDCVAVPTMYEPLCSPRLLVMEWVDGVKVRRATCSPNLHRGLAQPLLEGCGRERASLFLSALFPSHG